MKFLNLIVLLSLFSLCYSTSLLFWNLRTFGKGRATEDHGIQMSEITNPYDILLFAEVKDANCDPIHSSCSIKDFFGKHFPDYQLYLSPPLYYDTPFKKSGSEEYAILVRKHISVQKMIEFSDNESVFIRRPFGIELTNGFKILLFHSHPNSEIELVSLSKVFQQFRNQKIILMGDLNTGCHYVGFDKLNRFDISKDYDWMIPENVFTNAEQTCPYDRVITTKDISHLCHQGYVLNHSHEAKRIDSDHYPIGIECNWMDHKMMSIGKRSIWKEKWLEFSILLFLILCIPFLVLF
jgi:hypothetical protein